jgi:uncharacterized protein (DUF58 family)
MNRPTLLPTPRLLFLLLTAVLLWAISGLVGFLTILALLVLVVLVLMVRLDWQRTPEPEVLQWQREHHTKMGLGAENVITIVVHNESERTLDVMVRDETPADFRLVRGSNRMGVRVPGRGQMRLNYEVKPTRRGDHQFGNLNVRWTSVLGLFVRQAAVPLPTRVKVYPNLLKISESERLSRLGLLLSGMRQSRAYGEAGMFEQLREYVPDDDYRRINWKATAKKGKLITSEYSPERSQNIIILVEMGAQMMTRPLGILRTTRLDLVINAVLMFSYTAISRGDRVGLLLFDNQVRRYLPPRSGDGQFYFIVEALYGAQGQPVDPNYQAALGYLRTQRQRRSLLVLLTDPGSQETADGLVGQLGAFYPSHLPLCVTLSDIAVVEAAKRPPYSVRSIYERAVAEQIVDQRQLWLEKLHQRGVMTLDVPAYQLTSAVINKYMELKERGRI